MRWLPDWTGHDWLFAGALMIAVIVVYLPVWHAGFVWDDDNHVTQNPCIVGPLGLKEIWTTNAARFFPLSLTTYWIIHSLWGLAPLPYHLANVLQHGASAIVLWRVLEGLRVPGARMGAALWALHPVGVESVAWIAELKNTQSALFYLLAILFYVKWLKTKPGSLEGEGAGIYGLSLLCAAAAMASKSSTVVLPLVLCLCAWWIEGGWKRGLVSAIPFFLVGGVASYLTIHAVKVEGVADYHPELWQRTWPERVVTVGLVVWFYLGRLIWPHPLMTIYPRWPIDSGHAVSYFGVVAVVAVLGMLWRFRNRWGRPYFFAFAYFLVALLPVLGLVDHYFLRFSLVADHMQYLAAIGPLALAGAMLSRIGAALTPGRMARGALYLGVLFVLGIVSWQRAWVYQSQESLWIDALAKNPAAWSGWLNLGRVHLQRGQFDAAVFDLRQAVAWNPGYAEAYNDLGRALVQEGNINEGLADFQKAVEIVPRFGPPHSNIGNIFLLRGQMDEAISEYQTAVQINPDDVAAHTSLGAVWLQKGDSNRALAEFQAAVALDPANSRAHYSLGLVLDQKGNADAAIMEYRAALEFDPQDALAAGKLGDDLTLAGQMDEAAAQYRKVLEINPGDLSTRKNLAVALCKKGEMDAAMDQFEKILAVSPNDPEVHNGMGIVLARKGEIVAAVAEFQEAVRLKPDFTGAKNNLAKAQAILRGVPAGTH